MMSTKEKISLKRADYPEQVGVSSKEIEAFIEDCKENNIEVHSIMVMSKGEVAFESWAAPYSPDIPHAMYSVSKTFTSAAIDSALPLPSTIKTAGVSVAQARSYADARAVIAMPS